MDILSHGLWGGVIWGRKNKRSFWLSFFFGITPDFFSFGIFFIVRMFSFGGFGRPEEVNIPSFVHHLYNITHSFVIFALVFAIVWLILKRPVWEMSAWAFHIFLDIFTHSTDFFPTPYAWPFHHQFINSISWGTPSIFFTNIFFLTLIYAVYWYRKKRYKI